jgi:sulfur-carrier protein adenylyltransferase/sulfurtransferase
MTPSIEPIFSADEWLRYTRHVQVPKVGAAGQMRLKRARVLIVGSGGLGSPVLFYFAAAGIGQLTIVDGDLVELTNLQRQILFTEQDIGLAKATAASTRLHQLNPNIKITAIDQYFSSENGLSLVTDHDLILDCTDNFATRYLLNDLCVQAQKPWIFASIFQFSGQCAMFSPGAACFRCLFPDPPKDVPDCNTGGVLGVLPGLVGMIQANEAIKYLLGLPTALSNSLMLIEALDLDFRRIRLQADPHCLTCGINEASADPVPLQDDDLLAAPEDNHASMDFEISPQEFDKVKGNQFSRLVDVRSDEERLAFHIGGDHCTLANLSEFVTNLSPGATIICYCQSGHRSLDAARQLRGAGYNAYSLRGGLAGWLQSRSQLS